MSLLTTIVACSVGVVFPHLPLVLVVVVIVGSILIVVHTLITGALRGSYTGACLECGGPGNWSP